MAHPVPLRRGVSPDVSRRTSRTTTRRKGRTSRREPGADQARGNPEEKKARAPCRGVSSWRTARPAGGRSRDARFGRRWFVQLRRAGCVGLLRYRQAVRFLRPRSAFQTLPRAARSTRCKSNRSVPTLGTRESSQSRPVLNTSAQPDMSRPDLSGPGRALPRRSRHH